MALMGFMAPILHAQLASGDKLTDAIIKYPYTWEHGSARHNITFRADGTGSAPDGDFKWHAVNEQEVEITTGSSDPFVSWPSSVTISLLTPEIFRRAARFGTSG